MRARRRAMALVITLMLIDAWMAGAAAATGSRPSGLPAVAGVAARR